MPKKPLVLCVDDQAPNLQVRTLMLQQFGCATLTATDHSSTLRVVSESNVDVVVIDYHLAHGENGEEIANDLRIMRPRLPLIMLTGDNQLPESAIASVNAVLIKGSSDPRALMDLIEQLVPDAELRTRKPMLVLDPNHGAKID